LEAQIKTEVNNALARERNSEGKRTLAGTNNGQFFFRNASPMRAAGSTGIRFYQVGDHVNNN
jgi:hypothetical protein